MSEVRLSLKALVIDDARVLTIRCRDDRGDWYMLPGGGQLNGETIPQSLARECLEETGCQVTVGPLRFVRDYIARNHEFAHDSGDFHQVELWFECETHGDIVEPSMPDNMQVGTQWLDLDRLADYRLYPRVLKDILVTKFGPETVYLGDVN